MLSRALPFGGEILDFPISRIRYLRYVSWLCQPTIAKEGIVILEVLRTSWIAIGRRLNLNLASARYVLTYLVVCR